MENISVISPNKGIEMWTNGAIDRGGRTDQKSRF